MIQITSSSYLHSIYEYKLLIMLSKKVAEFNKEKRKHMKIGLTEKDAHDELIAENAFKSANFNKWESCINHGLKSRKIEKAYEPGVTQFNMEEEVDDGYNIRDGSFNNKANLDPWYESVRNEIEEKEKMLSKKRAQENLIDDTSKEGKTTAKDDDDDNQYYGEENLFFSLEEAMTNDEKRDKEVQIYNNRKAILNKLKQNNQESLAKYLSSLEKAKQSCSKNSTVILSNGKKVRKSNQTFKNGLKANDQSLEQSGKIDNELLNEISILTDMGDHDIMSMTVSEIEDWIKTQVHNTCSYRIVPKDESEQIKEYKNLDINKVKVWIENKILCSNEDYEIEFSIDNTTWFKDQSLLI